MSVTLRLHGDRDGSACEVTGYTLVELRSSCEYVRSLLDFGTGSAPSPWSDDAPGSGIAAVFGVHTGACRASLAASVLHFLMRGPVEAPLDVDGATAAELLSLADLWCLSEVKTHVLMSLRRSMCNSFRRPAVGTGAVECIPQVATLARQALDFGVGDADGGLQRTYDDCTTWLATWSARAWPTRAFAGMQRAIQDDVLAAAKARVGVETAPAVLAACRQLSGMPSVAWAKRVGEIRTELTAFTLSYIWSNFSEICVHAGMRRDRSECWGALLEELRAHVLENPDPNAAVRALPRWAATTRALLHGKAAAPKREAAGRPGSSRPAAAAAEAEELPSWLSEDEAAQMQEMYEMVHSYCVRHLSLVARCAEFRALPHAQQQQILQVAQDGVATKPGPSLGPTQGPQQPFGTFGPAEPAEPAAAGVRASAAWVISSLPGPSSPSAAAASPYTPAGTAARRREQRPPATVPRRTEASSSASSASSASSNPKTPARDQPQKRVPPARQLWSSAAAAAAAAGRSARPATVAAASAVPAAGAGPSRRVATGLQARPASGSSGGSAAGGRLKAASLRGSDGGHLNEGASIETPRVASPPAPYAAAVEAAAAAAEGAFLVPQGERQIAAPEQVIGPQQKTEEEEELQELEPQQNAEKEEDMQELAPQRAERMQHTQQVDQPGVAPGRRSSQVADAAPEPQQDPGKDETQPEEASPWTGARVAAAEGAAVAGAGAVEGRCAMAVAAALAAEVASETAEAAEECDVDGSASRWPEITGTAETEVTGMLYGVRSLALASTLTAYPTPGERSMGEAAELFVEVEAEPAAVAEEVSSGANSLLGVGSGETMSSVPTGATERTPRDPVTECSSSGQEAGDEAGDEAGPQEDQSSGGCAESDGEGAGACELVVAAASDGPHSAASDAAGASGGVAVPVPQTTHDVGALGAEAPAPTSALLGVAACRDSSTAAPGDAVLGVGCGAPVASLCIARSATPPGPAVNAAVAAAPQPSRVMVAAKAPAALRASHSSAHVVTAATGASAARGSRTKPDPQPAANVAAGGKAAGSKGVPCAGGRTSAGRLGAEVDPAAASAARGNDAKPTRPSALSPAAGASAAAVAAAGRLRAGTAATQLSITVPQDAPPPTPHYLRSTTSRATQSAKAPAAAAEGKGPESGVAGSPTSGAGPRSTPATQPAASPAAPLSTRGSGNSANSILSPRTTPLSTRGSGNSANSILSPRTTPLSTRGSGNSANSILSPRTTPLSTRGSGASANSILSPRTASDWVRTAVAPAAAAATTPSGPQSRSNSAHRIASPHSPGNPAAAVTGGRPSSTTRTSSVQRTPLAASPGASPRTAVAEAAGAEAAAPPAARSRAPLHARSVPQHATATATAAAKSAGAARRPVQALAETKEPAGGAVAGSSSGGAARRSATPSARPASASAFSRPTPQLRAVSSPRGGPTAGRPDGGADTAAAGGDSAVAPPAGARNRSGMWR